MNELAGGPPIDPGVALIWFGALVVLVGALAWPRYGLIARLLQLTRMTERVRFEDALKHFINREGRRHPPSVESLAGALEISRGLAVRLVAELERLDMARSTAGDVELTEAGRQYAIRIVRTHRLWERYLADRTGVPAVEWHDRAERYEHLLTEAETESLAARMGHPLYDPHGDPIPTAEGQLPPARGVPLPTLAVGSTARVVHLEDEPQEVFERLVNEGLAPGATVTVAESTPHDLTLRVNGREFTIEPVLANNITVAASPSDNKTPPDNLSRLRPGEAATIVGIAPTCQGPQRRRLLDLGVVPGSVVRAEFTSASGDPMAYRIRDALVALRKNQAVWVYISPLAGEA